MGFREPANLFRAGMPLPPFPHGINLRFKLDVSRFTGTNQGAQQHAIFIMGGGQYEHAIGKERLFAEALAGECGLNRYWGPQAMPGGTASFTSFLGGGADTPINRHFALRVEGGFQYTNFALVQSMKTMLPYRVPGLPTYFGRMSAGIVWTPRLNPGRKRRAQRRAHAAGKRALL